MVVDRSLVLLALAPVSIRLRINWQVEGLDEAGQHSVIADDNHDIRQFVFLEGFWIIEAIFRDGDELIFAHVCRAGNGNMLLLFVIGAFMRRHHQDKKLLVVVG